jgi:cell division transport system permease protein
LAVLLTFVSFSLISNTVRLSVYARRFIIHTMKLVGASWGFIRRPFIRNAVMVGLIAAILANIVLGACFYGLYLTQPGILTIIQWEELAITAGAVFLFGLLITALCAWLAVNKFLKMTAGELYKI